VEAASYRILKYHPNDGKEKLTLLESTRSFFQVLRRPHNEGRGNLIVWADTLNVAIGERIAPSEGLRIPQILAQMCNRRCVDCRKRLGIVL